MQKAVWLLLSVVLLTPVAHATPLEVERVELDVRIDPRAQALYAKAQLVLRNRGAEHLDVVELDFPAPLGPHVQVRVVWDSGGELSWRADLVKDDGSRTLLVELRRPLAPGKKLGLVVGYDVDLTTTPAADAVTVSAESAQLATTGWYPLPTDSDPALPRRLRLTAHVPKQWQVAAPVKWKRVRDGTELASYELELETIEASQLLFRAGTSRPP